jgi:3-isopropylmalate/(R)-2-methylmalate dehydratase large subunit
LAAALAEEQRMSTLYDKLWAEHVVLQRPGHPAVLYIDLHLMHEGTYLQAFETLEERGMPVHRPDRTVATTDHFVPTVPAQRFGEVTAMPYVVGGLVEAAQVHGVTVFGPNDERQGIVHVIGPELGLTQPGRTIVCGDSHTSTHGAFGALAFGIGTTQVGHVLATQTLLFTKQRNLRITIDGQLGSGVTAKDVALHVLARWGVELGRGHVIEFAGSTVRAMSMRERMSLCNMSIEMGSRASLIAPDQTTFDYLEGRPYAPSGAAWDEALTRWRGLVSDPDAVFDKEMYVDAADIEPMVTYGTTPGMGTAVGGSVPVARPDHVADEASYDEALDYMALERGDALIGKPVSTVFIGSCTNARLEDLRDAASVIRGRHVADGTTLVVVPGSQAVKRAAEAEGIDAVFVAAGARWGEPSCSMCLGVNGDVAPAGSYTASTSNRNFEGRQGPGARSLLMSPLTAAACAVTGVVTDPRTLPPASPSERNEVVA